MLGPKVPKISIAKNLPTIHGLRLTANCLVDCSGEQWEALDDEMLI